MRAPSIAEQTTDRMRRDTARVPLTPADERIRKSDGVVPETCLR